MTFTFTRKTNIDHIPGIALVIPPLLTIQIQMAKICTEWSIPYLDLSQISKQEDLAANIERKQPKIILMSIEDVSNPAIQSSLQLLDIKYVAVDECQVHLNHN